MYDVIQSYNSPVVHRPLSRQWCPPKSGNEYDAASAFVYIIIERQRVIDRNSQTWPLLSGLTLTQPRSTVLTEPSIRCCALVPITVASVLSGLINRPLRSSQCWIIMNENDTKHHLQITGIGEYKDTKFITRACTLKPNESYINGWNHMQL